jgi:hypothetical protein
MPKIAFFDKIYIKGLDMVTSLLVSLCVQTRLSLLILSYCITTNMSETKKIAPPKAHCTLISLECPYPETLNDAENQIKKILPAGYNVPKDHKKSIST